MERRDFLGSAVGVPGALAALAAGGVPEPPGSRPAARPHDRPRTGLDERFDALVRLAEAQMAAHRIPGAALGVLADGVLQTRGLGVTSVEDPRPVTPDTLFELASLSKVFTATAAMALVERGGLDLDAPVRRHLPAFRVRDEAVSASVTLRHLLTHSAGWEARYDVEEGEGALGRWVPTMEDLIQIAPPGRVWSYNNTCWGLAGHLIEVVTGQEIRDALADLVFAPLGLERATAHITEVVTWPLALGHRPGPGGEPRVVRPYSMGSSIPAGGVNASLASLMAFAAFHLGEHDGVTGDVLSSRGREALCTPQVRKEPTGEWMGLGWHLRTLDGVLTAAHSGSAGAGHRCHVQIVPERRLAFAVLTNHTEGWRLRHVVEKALLASFEGLALAPGQPVVGYRGHTEPLDHVTPLAAQPPAADYVGRYRRGRGSVVEVRAAPGGGLLVGDDPAPVLFYGDDVAFRDDEERTNHDFVREGGRVRWMRVGGQVGRREP